MRCKALALSLILTFDPSPSPGVDGYVCRTSMRVNVMVPATPDCPAPCMVIGPPQPIACTILANQPGGPAFGVHIESAVPLGGVVWGCVYAVDFEEGVSECVGGPSSTPIAGLVAGPTEASNIKTRTRELRRKRSGSGLGPKTTLLTW